MDKFIFGANLRAGELIDAPVAAKKRKDTSTPHSPVQLSRPPSLDDLPPRADTTYPVKTVLDNTAAMRRKFSNINRMLKRHRDARKDAPDGQPWKY